MSRRAGISGIFGLLSEGVQTGCSVRPPRGGFALECRQAFTKGCWGPRSPSHAWAAWRLHERSGACRPALIQRSLAAHSVQARPLGLRTEFFARRRGQGRDSGPAQGLGDVLPDRGFVVLQELSVNLCCCRAVDFDSYGRGASFAFTCVGRMASSMNGAGPAAPR